MDLDNNYKKRIDTSHILYQSEKNILFNKGNIVSYNDLSKKQKKMFNRGEDVIVFKPVYCCKTQIENPNHK